MNIISHLREIEKSRPEYKNFRYFDCDGFPDKCHVHLVGINPSKGLGNNKTFWNYWNDTHGFNLLQLLTDYKEENKRYKDGLKPTRKRIENIRNCLLENKVKLLNYNLYPKATKREKDLTEDDRTTDIFELLLKCPDIKVLVLHGNQPKLKYSKIATNFDRTVPHWTITESEIHGKRLQVITVPHLFNMAISKEKKPNVQILVNLIMLAINGNS